MSLETLSLLDAAREGDNRACERLLEENSGLVWSAGIWAAVPIQKICINWGVWDFSRQYAGLTPIWDISFPPMPCPKSLGRSAVFCGTMGR